MRVGWCVPARWMATVLVAIAVAGCSLAQATPTPQDAARSTPAGGATDAVKPTAQGPSPTVPSGSPAPAVPSPSPTETANAEPSGMTPTPRPTPRPTADTNPPPDADAEHGRMAPRRLRDGHRVTSRNRGTGRCHVLLRRGSDLLRDGPLPEWVLCHRARAALLRDDRGVGVAVDRPEVGRLRRRGGSHFTCTYYGVAKVGTGSFTIPGQPSPTHTPTPMPTPIPTPTPIANPRADPDPDPVPVELYGRARVTGQRGRRGRLDHVYGQCYDDPPPLRRDPRATGRGDGGLRISTVHGDLAGGPVSIPPRAGRQARGRGRGNASRTPFGLIKTESGELGVVP